MPRQIEAGGAVIRIAADLSKLKRQLSDAQRLVATRMKRIQAQSSRLRDPATGRFMGSGKPVQLKVKPVVDRAAARRARQRIQQTMRPVTLEVRPKIQAAIDKIKSLRSQITGLAQQAAHAGRTLLAVGGGLGFGLAGAVKAANDAEAINRRFQAIFGELTGEAESFVQKLDRTIGGGVINLKAEVAGVAGLLKGLEFEDADVLTLSKRLLTLQRDFAAFNGIKPGEAADRFRSALSGSAEVLDQFGINIKAAALDQEFLRRGLDVTTATASEQQKTIARLSIIQRSLVDQGAIGAAGKFAKTAAGQFQKLTVEFQKAKIALGNQLLPIAIEFTKRAAAMVTRVKELIKENPKLGQTLARVAIGLIVGGAAMLGLSFAGYVLSGALGAVQLALTAMKFSLVLLISPIGKAAIAIAGLVAGAAYLTGTLGKLGDIGGRVADGLKDDFLDSFGAIGNALASGDLAKAGAIAMQLLRVVVARGGLAIQEVFELTKDNVVNIAENTWAALKIRYENGIAAVKTALLDVLGEIKQEFAAAGAFLEAPIIAAENALARLTGGKIDNSTIAERAAAAIAKADAGTASDKDDVEQVRKDGVAGIEAAADTAIQAELDNTPEALQGARDEVDRQKQQLDQLVDGVKPFELKTPDLTGKGFLQGLQEELDALEFPELKMPGLDTSKAEKDLDRFEDDSRDASEDRSGVSTSATNSPNGFSAQGGVWYEARLLRGGHSRRGRQLFSRSGQRRRQAKRSRLPRCVQWLLSV